MPGLLKPSACCPVCDVPIVALVDESSTYGVKRKFYHDKDPQASRKARRPLLCRLNYTDHAVAALDRRLLEVSL